jgi:proline dehydrogenase
LGEHTTTPEVARRATEDIIKIFDAIDESGICANVSIKLTQIGLAVDEDLCVYNLRCLLTAAKEHQIFVRIDMEDSPWVDTTLAIYHKMKDEYGLDNTGVVIQAYLYRTEADIRSLGAEGTRIRLCKGAYKELPEVAFPKKKDVDANYDRMASLLVDSSQSAGAPPASQDGKFPAIPAIASHDPARLAYARAYAEKVGLPKRAIEFQMLNGIRRDLQEQYAQDGYPVRIYVPYGTEWYPYFMRRLAERPANLWFFISNFFHK